MALYGYMCAECGHTFDRLIPFEQSAEVECPQCAGAARRQLSVAGLGIRFSKGGMLRLSSIPNDVHAYNPSKNASTFGPGGKREHIG